MKLGNGPARMTVGLKKSRNQTNTGFFSKWFDKNALKPGACG